MRQWEESAKNGTNKDADNKEETFENTSATVTPEDNQVVGDAQYSTNNIEDDTQ